MSETIKLCAMLVRHVFAPDDEARDEEMRRPFVEQAMRAKREHDEMRRNLAEADTTRREWEVRAATSYAAGRAAGLREAAEVCHAIKQENGDDPRVWLVDYMEECEQRILALAPPAAETVRTETIFGCRTCPASTPGWTDGRFASPGWGRIDHIDGPNAICPVCAADPTSLDCLREEYPDVTPVAEPRDEGEVSDG